MLTFTPGHPIVPQLYSMVDDLTLWSHSSGKGTSSTTELDHLALCLPPVRTQGELVGKPKVQVSLLYNTLPWEKVFNLLLWCGNYNILFIHKLVFCLPTVAVHTSGETKIHNNLQNPICRPCVSRYLAFFNSFIVPLKTLQVFCTFSYLKENATLFTQLFSLQLII